VPAEKIIPANGVYLVELTLEDKKYYGLMNIGIRPTFQEQSRTIEIHILEFNQNIYDKKLNIEILEKIRGEKCFGHPDLLKKQIEEDISLARKIISKKDNLTSKLANWLTS